MKLFRKIPFFILFLFCLINLQGQTNFIPGYIVTNENDTLQGLLDYRGDIRNSRKCEFKENENALAKEFLPFSIKGYRFTESKYYVSKYVLSEGNKTPVFLEFLVNGISDLYFYNAGIEDHYYIEKADGKLIELTNEFKPVQVDGNNYISESKKYIGILKLAFADCQQLFPMIKGARLEEKSLIAITKKYHDYMCDGEKCIVYEKQLPVVRVKFGSFISMNGSFLTFNKNPLYQAIHFRMAAYPTIGLQLNTSMPKANEKLSFQVSGEFGKSYFYGTGINPANSAFEEINLHAFLLKGKVGFKYTYPKGKIRPTLLIGGNIIKLMKTNGKRIEERLSYSTVYTSEWKDVPVSDMLLGYHVDLGIDYYHSATLVPFVKLGYESSVGNNDFILSQSTTTIINTINLNVGIYF